MVKSGGRCIHLAFHLPCRLLDGMGFRIDSLGLLEFLEVAGQEGALKGE